MQIQGKKMAKAEMKKYTGDMSQLFSARRSVLLDGMGAGTEIIEVNAGEGFSFTVVPSRAFDIAWMSYKGKNISYITKTGMVAPQYYDPDGGEFLRSFYAGFLTTCGLLNVGAGCEEDGRKYRVHGRVSNIPAEEVSVQTRFEGDDPVIELTGKVREASFFSEYMTLTRRITAIAGTKSLKIEDIVENCGVKPTPFMLMYHMNLGYPLISESTKFEFESENIEPLSEVAREGLDEIKTSLAPQETFSEQGFIITPKTENSRYTVAIKNPAAGFGVKFELDAKALPKWMLWKMFQYQDYVVGVEPFNGDNSGYKNAKEKGTLRMLAPGESWKSEMTFSVFD